MLENYPDVLTVDDLCTLLRIGRNSAYKMLQESKIPCRRLRGKYIIPKAGVIDFLQNCEEKNTCMSSPLMI